VIFRGRIVEFLLALEDGAEIVMRNREIWFAINSVSVPFCRAGKVASVVS
jgi:hypothetical protein